MLTTNHIARKKRLQGSRIGHLLKGKGLIIEFVGPTGSGKTTNCFHFLEFFRKRNIKAYSFNDIKVYARELTFYHRLQLCFEAVLLNWRQLLSFTFLLARR